MSSPLPSKQRSQLPPNARVLVVRLSALGDVVFAIPAVAALRKMLPDAQIDWLVEDRHASLLRSLPLHDECHIFPRSAWKGRGGLGRIWKHIRDLRRLRRYDVILDFQGNLKSSMQVRAIPAELKIGFDRGVAKEGAYRRYDHRVANPGRVPRALRDFALVRELAQLKGLALPGADGSSEASKQLPAIAQLDAWPMPSDVIAEMAVSLATDAQQNQPLVLLHTSVTSYGKDKEWPLEGWVELIRGLTKQDRRVRLLWTPGDRPHVEKILSYCPQAQLAPPTPSLEHLMALLDEAALTIGTDSGPVHLAALRGNRVLGLYGPTDPVRFAPPGPDVHLISALPLDQEPPKRDRSCRSPLMEQIAAADVLAQAVKLLDA